MTPPPQVQWFVRTAQRIQENRYLLDDWFIIKRSNSRMVEWKRWTGQDMGEGYRANMQRACHTQSPHPTPTPAESSQNLLEFFMEASLPSHSWLNHWPLVINVQPLFLPWRWGAWKAEFQPSDHRIGFLATVPHPQLSSSHFITMNSGVVERGLLWRIKDTHFKKRIYLLMFGCTGSSLLHTGFL